MRRGGRGDFWIFLGIVVAWALLARMAGQAELAPPPLPPLAELGAGRPAPDFALPDLAGGSHRLSEQRGELVFLNFWATWCGPCRHELPALEKLHRELGGRGLEVLAVSIDSAPADTVARFARESGIGFRVLHDPEAVVARRFGVSVYPTSILLDRDGRVLLGVPSAWDWGHPDALAWLRELLARPRSQ